MICPNCKLPIPEKHDRGPGLRCRCWQHGPTHLHTDGATALDWSAVWQYDPRAAISATKALGQHPGYAKFRAALDKAIANPRADEALAIFRAEVQGVFLEAPTGHDAPSTDP